MKLHSWAKLEISLRIIKGIFNRLCRFVLVFCTFRFRVSWGLNLSNILNNCARPTVQLVTHTTRIWKVGVTTINESLKSKHNTWWWTNNKRVGLGQAIPPPKNYCSLFLEFLSYLLWHVVHCCLYMLVIVVWSLFFCAVWFIGLALTVTVQPVGEWVRLRVRLVVYKVYGLKSLILTS